MNETPLLAAIRAIRAEVDEPRRQALAWQAVLDHPAIPHWLAKNVLRGHMSRDDAHVEAQIAFYEALLYVDPEKGSVFKIARWYLLSEIRPRYGVYVPRNVIEAVRRHLRESTMDPDAPFPDDPRIGIGTLSDEDRARLRYLLTEARIRETPGMTSTEWTSLDATPLVATIDEESIDLHVLCAALAKMPVRVRDAALAGCGEGSLQDVGDRHGVSRERIRQIQVLARKTLTDHLVGGLPLQQTPTPVARTSCLPIALYAHAYPHPPRRSYEEIR